MIFIISGLWVQVMLLMCTWVWRQLLVHGEPTSGHTHLPLPRKEKWVTLPQQPSAVNSSSARDRTMVVLSSPRGNLDQLDLVEVLCMLPQFLWVDRWFSHIMSRTQHFPEILNDRNFKWPRNIVWRIDLITTGGRKDIQWCLKKLSGLHRMGHIFMSRIYILVI